jgi:hypothetical protein
VIDEVDRMNMGTGTYVVVVKLIKRVPNMLPMFGQKVMAVQKSVKTAMAIIREI